MTCTPLEPLPLEALLPPVPPLSLLPLVLLALLALLALPVLFAPAPVLAFPFAFA